MRILTPHVPHFVVDETFSGQDSAVLASRMTVLIASCMAVVPKTP